jgi:hypothetical protein
MLRSCSEVFYCSDPHLPPRHHPLLLLFLSLVHLLYPSSIFLFFLIQSLTTITTITTF